MWIKNNEFSNLFRARNYCCKMIGNNWPFYCTKEHFVWDLNKNKKLHPPVVCKEKWRKHSTPFCKEQQINTYHKEKKLRPSRVYGASEEFFFNCFFFCKNLTLCCEQPFDSISLPNIICTRRRVGFADADACDAFSLHVLIAFYDSSTYSAGG